MISKRPSSFRGKVDLGWLQSQNSFSFGSYFDPNHMGYHQLRVINEDRVKAGSGFEPHRHRDMEIISYMIEGELEHQDSLGNQDVIRVGEVQRMTAGTGVVHSEYNPSNTSDNHFLQIWLYPDQKGLAPDYERKFFGDPPWGNWRKVVSPTGDQGSLRINQQISIYDAKVEQGKRLVFQNKLGQAYWLQLILGELRLRNIEMRAGDGAAIMKEDIDFLSVLNSHLLLFELSTETGIN